MTVNPEKSTMVGLTSEQRHMLIDKLPDLANLTLGATLFGQLLSEQPFSLMLCAGGLLGGVALFTFSFLVGGKSQT
jgi:hypothetical protein